MMFGMTNRNRLTFDIAVSAEVRAEIARHHGTTVLALSERLGIRRATLSDRVNGKSPFTTALLSAVATELGTTASEITRRAEAELGRRTSEKASA